MTTLLVAVVLIGMILTGLAMRSERSAHLYRSVSLRVLSAHRSSAGCGGAGGGWDGGSRLRAMIPPRIVHD